MKKTQLLIIALVFFATNTFAKDGLYVEFKMTAQSMHGTTKGYSLDGNTRNETTVEIAAMPGPRNIVSLTRQDAPGKVYMLSEADKTYTETDISHTNNEEDDYEITILGKEKVNNYYCTHVKMLNKRTQKESDVWLSRDIANYAMYASVKNKYLSGHRAFEALKAKGADGYIVRLLITDERAGQIQMDLVKAEKRNIDPDMFSLNGYARAGGMAPGNPSYPGAVDVQKIQNMTPEERQKYIEQLKQQYQQQPH